VAELYAKVRAPGTGVAPLGADRPPAPDLTRLARGVAAGVFAPPAL
jgi:hypothetical protein